MKPLEAAVAAHSAAPVASAETEGPQLPPVEEGAVAAVVGEEVAASVPAVVEPSPGGVATVAAAAVGPSFGELLVVEPEVVLQVVVVAVVASGAVQPHPDKGDS